MTAEPYDVPLLTAKDYAAPSLFEPANLLREARRQKRLPPVDVPAVGLLDPDGDIVRYLAASGRGQLHPGWACYHTQMWIVDLDGVEVGVVGMAGGAPFAVLVAEQLAASGAELVISVTSAPVSRLAAPSWFPTVASAAPIRPAWDDAVTVTGSTQGLHHDLQSLLDLRVVSADRTVMVSAIHCNVLTVERIFASAGCGAAPRDRVHRAP